MDHEGSNEVTAEELREIASDGGELVVDSGEVANSLVACGFEIKNSSGDGSEFVLQVKAEDEDHGGPGEASRLPQPVPVDLNIEEELQSESSDDSPKALCLSETAKSYKVVRLYCSNFSSGAPISGDVLDWSRRLKPFENLRCIYGTGKEEVELITQYVSEFAYCVAGLSNTAELLGLRGEPDGFLKIMLAEVEYMLGSSELRDTPLCCSFLLRCALEYEATFRPRLALAQYEKAQGVASKDPANMDLLVRAIAGVGRLMASGIPVTEAGSCPRAWDNYKLFLGPYYSRSDKKIWMPEWDIEPGDGRKSFRDFAFSMCDFIEKRSGGDREEFINFGKSMIGFVLHMNPQIVDSPLHCCTNLYFANDLKKMGQLDVELYRIALDLAANDPELFPEFLQAFEELLSDEVCYDRQRLMELVDFPTLYMIGYNLLRSSNIEGARNCFIECLVKASPGNFDGSTAVHFQLSQTYMLQKDVKNALNFLEKTRLSAEVEGCQCISFGGARPLTQGTLEFGLRRLKCCPRHHFLPKVLLEQGRLQRYELYSVEEAKETFKKGLELAKECNDIDLVLPLQDELLRIYADQWLNMERYTAGNFSTPKSDHNTEVVDIMQDNISWVEQRNSIHLEALLNSQDYISGLERRNFLDVTYVDNVREANIIFEHSKYELQFIKAAPHSDDDFKHRVEHHKKVLAELQDIHASEGLQKEDNLVKVRMGLVSSLLNWTGATVDVIKPHFEEAFNHVSSAYAHREDEDAAEAQLLCGSFATQPKIKAFDKAIVLFKRVIQVLNQKLPQLTTREVEVPIRFLDMKKHAFSLLIHTYSELAMRSAFEVDEDGIRCLGKAASIEYFGLDETKSHMQQSLLWAERSKGRVLSKLLDPSSITVASSSEGKANRVHLPSNDDYHSPTSAKIDVGISERKFHNNDDWAMNFLFNGEKFIHHGSRMLFMVYTMFGNEGLIISLVNGEDGTILAYVQEFLSNVIDEKTQKLAEDEMLQLIKGLRGYKNSDEHPASEPVIPPSLYAMNEPGIRMSYYNTCITGIVARIQRLVYEAVRKRQQHKKCENEIREVDDLLQKLYNILIPRGLAELLHQLFEKYADCTLVFVPHEDLSVVPFQALRDRDGKYLIEKYPVSVSPSMWITRHCQHLYDKQIRTPSGPELLVGRRASTQNFSELRKAHEEIASIKRFCGQKAVEVLDSGDDSKLSMKERVMEHAQTASWAHFAAHGEISDRYPHGSLVLDDDDMDRWKSDEITEAGLPCARSVVLSACQSGLGTLGGEGVLGFARKLVIAGAPSCVLSMWHVGEEFTLRFMQQLYEHLHRGEDLAHAMQKSTKIMIQQLTEKRFSGDPIPQSRRWSILDWAAFSCIGYGGVKFPNRSSTSEESPHGRMMFAGSLSPWVQGNSLSTEAARAFGYLNLDPAWIENSHVDAPRPNADTSAEPYHVIPWSHVACGLLHPSSVPDEVLERDFASFYEQREHDRLRPSTSASTAAKASTLPRQFYSVEDPKGKGKAPE